jgi:hypothetical protein
MKNCFVLACAFACFAASAENGESSSTVAFYPFDEGAPGSAEDGVRRKVP